jgi:hypothetical protein
VQVLTNSKDHPGFDIKRNLFDMMHVMQLGTDKIFLASALLDLCRRGKAAGTTLDEQLRGLFVEMQTWCKDCNNTSDNLLHILGFASTYVE